MITAGNKVFISPYDVISLYKKYYQTDISVEQAQLFATTESDAIINGEGMIEFLSRKSYNSFLDEAFADKLGNTTHYKKDLVLLINMVVFNKTIDKVTLKDFAVELRRITQIQDLINMQVAPFHLKQNEYAKIKLSELNSLSDEDFLKKCEEIADKIEVADELPYVEV